MFRSRLVSSIAIVTVSEVFNKIFPIVTIYIAQSRLGLEKLGFAQYLVFLLDLAVPFVVWGYYGVGVHELASAKLTHEKKREVFSAILFLRLAHAFLAVFILLLCVNFYSGWAPYRRAVTYLCFLPLLSALSCSYVFVATQRTGLQARIGLLSKFCVFGAIILLVSDSDDAILYAGLVYAIGPIINIHSLLLMLREYPLMKVPWREMKRIFIQTFPFSAPVLTSFLCERVDLFVIEAHFDWTDLGGYSGPMRINQSLISFGTTLAFVFQSEVIGVGESEKIKKLTGLCFLSLLYVFLPLVVSVWFVDEDLIRVLLGQNFGGYGRVWSAVTLQLMIYPFALVATQIALFREKRMYDVAVYWVSFSGLGFLGGTLAAITTGDLFFTALGLFCGKAIATLGLLFSSTARFGSRLSGADLLRLCICLLATVITLSTGVLEEHVWFRVLLCAVIFALALAILNREKIGMLLAVNGQKRGRE